jgi:2-polyprenyl-3-methyl-5-hydroxy-6-metoxy-1,4-benzoquinol methylase
MSLFVIPTLEVLTDPKRAGHYMKYSSYSHYNYLRLGLIPYIKRRRIDTALKVSRQYFGSVGAIDIGCADGVLLPSLSKYFANVAGIDPDDSVLDMARLLIEKTPLKNVTLLNNRNMSLASLRQRLGGTYRIAFILETLEHVGSLPNLYESKAEFVDGVFSLLLPDGIIIVSVPRMVGLLFLIKYLIQWSLRIPMERIPWKEVFRSAFSQDTSNLEAQWNGGHIGFNHIKLTQVLRSRFELIACKGTLSSIFYVIARKPSAISDLAPSVTLEAVAGPSRAQP